MYAEMSLQDYLDETASAAPVPGGGSVAALAASLAAALTRMVAGLTLGRAQYASVEEEMKAIDVEAAHLLSQCQKHIDADPAAYAQVMLAFKLPRNTAEEKTFRRQAIQNAFKQATRVPLAVARNALQLLTLAGSALGKGNPNAVTDAAVAVLMARAAGLGALYNVRINLTSIRDDAFIERTLDEVKGLERKIFKTEKEILTRLSI